MASVQRLNTIASEYSPTISISSDNLDNGHLDQSLSNVEVSWLRRPSTCPMASQPGAGLDSTKLARASEVNLAKDAMDVIYVDPAIL